MWRRVPDDAESGAAPRPGTVLIRMFEVCGIWVTCSQIQVRR